MLASVEILSFIQQIGTKLKSISLTTSQTVLRPVYVISHIKFFNRQHVETVLLKLARTVIAVYLERVMARAAIHEHVGDH